MFKKLIAIVGPTASGKTEMALKLAKKFKGFVISADSRQIYQEMNIGTAKPIKMQFASWWTKCKIQNNNAKYEINSKIPIVKGIPYFMIDLIKPDQEFTVFDYQKKVFEILKIFQKGRLEHVLQSTQTKIAQLPKTKIVQSVQSQINQSQYHLPFLVGGTGLYISAIIDNLKFIQIPPDKNLREKLEKEIQEKGLDFLYQKLIKLDPKTKNFVEPKNPRRIIRALEICLVSKKLFSDQKKKSRKKFESVQIGIMISKEKLNKKIFDRTNKMIKKGLIEETEKLLQKDYSLNLPSMSGIGYKEIIQWILEKKKKPIKEVIEEINQRTRQYAKRQMTWFKKDKRIIWIENEKQAIKIMNQEYALLNFLKS